MAEEELSSKKLAGDLLEAVKSNNLDKVSSLLQQGADPNLFNCLHEACERGYLPIVKALVEHGADVEKCISNNQSPLLYTCWYSGSLDIVVYLTREAKCKLDVRDNDGDTPLHHACYRGHRKITQYLVQDLKYDVEVKNNNGRTPFYCACESGLKDVVQFLVKVGKCNFDMRDNFGQTPVHRACEEGHKDIVQYLTEDLKCDVDVRDKENRTPLHMACLSGNKDTVVYLIEQKHCSVDVRDDDGESPLDIVLSLYNMYNSDRGAECTEIAYYLMSRGCGDDLQKGLLLIGACRWGKLDMVKELIEQHQVNPKDVRDKTNSTPLHMACHSGNKDTVVYLIEQKECSVDVRDDDGESPLDTALDLDNMYDSDRGAGCTEIAYYLMSRGCGDDQQKGLLLIGACRWGKLDMVKELIEQHQVNPKDVRDKTNSTPLHMACHSGNKDTVVYLIEQKHCSVDVRDDGKETPLHLACYSGNKDTVVYLVEQQHCSVDVRNNNKVTPLHYACASGNKDTVVYLVEQQHCSVEVTDKWDDTPLDDAIRCGHTEVVEYLESLKKSTTKHGSAVPDSSTQTQPLTAQANKQASPAETAKTEGTDETDGTDPSASPAETAKTVGTDETDGTDPSDPLSSYPTVEQLRQLQVENWLRLGQLLRVPKHKLDSGKKDHNSTAAILKAAKEKNPELKWRDLVDALQNIGEYATAAKLCQQEVGHTPLSMCAFYGWVDLLDYLLEKGGSDIKKPINEAGDTVLSLACSKGHIDMIHYLVKENGLNHEGPVNSAGDTLRTIAESHQQSKVIKYLDNINSDEIDRSFLKQKFKRKLKELMNDRRHTTELRYLKLYFIGPSGLGKTTIRKRLTKLIENLSSLPPEERERCSTFLAECTQVLAIVNEVDSKLDLKAAKDLDHETQMLFAYLYGGQSGEDDTTPDKVKEQHKPDQTQGKTKKDHTQETRSKNPTEKPISQSKETASEEKEQKTAGVTLVDIDQVVTRLRSVVGSGKYAEQLLAKILLNLVDVGGQPGFLEMLPFLSKGPGMFLAFFPLDKGLDEPCEVSYEREGKKITPYQSTYTTRETLYQILSAISHHVSFDPEVQKEFGDLLGSLSSVKPVATLVGTFLDKVETQVKAKVLKEELSTEFPDTSESDMQAAIVSPAKEQSSEVRADLPDSSLPDSAKEQRGEVSTGPVVTPLQTVDLASQQDIEEGAAKSTEQSSVVQAENKPILLSDSEKAVNRQASSSYTEVTALDSSPSDPSTKQQSSDTSAEDTPKSPEATRGTPKIPDDLQKAVNQKLSSDSFKAKVKKELEKELKEKKAKIRALSRNYKDLIRHPHGQEFFPVDNLNGTDSDLNPLRDHLQKVFDSAFKDAKLRIRPSQLLLGVVLRKEFDIVSMEDAIEIGKRALKMSKDEVEFTVSYLDFGVGALIYHPEIEDEDNWFKLHIICSPQVVFNSISMLITECLLSVHGDDDYSSFDEEERENWKYRGQFSLETVKHCHSEECEKKLREGKLIPVDKLVKLLEHSNLLARIEVKKVEGGKVVYKPMCFIPAILECANPKQLTKSPPPDVDTPASVKITFEPRYVPIGVFCAMISRLASRGKGGILGMKWKLLDSDDSSVKRNLVTFQVDSAEHIVTLVAHVECIEIRLIRQDRSITVHNLASYVLSTVIFMIKEINSLVTPIIAFDCDSGGRNADKLCILQQGVTTCFKSGKKTVSLSAHQERWFAKEVKPNSRVSLMALQYAKKADMKGLTFEWSKDRPEIGSDNELKLEMVTEEDSEGYYTCEIFKDGESFFNVYHCLKATGEPQVSEEEELLDEVRDVLRDARSDWYSLAVELGINYATRKDIDYHRTAEVCFRVMLRNLVESLSSPDDTWAALVGALRSPAIDLPGLADDIESEKDIADDEEQNTDLCLPSGPLNVDKHLKAVRAATWEVRSKWRALAVELEISVGDRDAIEGDHRGKVGPCFTALLETWMTKSPPPTLEPLIEALKCPVIGQEDIAGSLEAMIQ